MVLVRQEYMVHDLGRPRKTADEYGNREQMSEFAIWMLQAMERRDVSMADMARAGVASNGYLSKIVNSSKEENRYFRQPSFLMGLKIGEYLADVPGALSHAKPPKDGQERPETQEQPTVKKAEIKFVAEGTRLTYQLNRRISRNFAKEIGKYIEFQMQKGLG